MKKVLIGIAVVVVLLLVAAVAAPFLIPVESYKPQIIAQAKEATGRDLRIDGPMRLSLIPRLEVEVSKVGFANAPGGQAKEMASLEKLRLALKLMPLLSGEVAVDSFVLDNPVIALEIDKQGKPNWEFAAGPKDAKEPAKPEAAKKGGGSALEQLRLDDIRINNGTLTYLDQRSGAKEQVSNLNLKVALPSLDQPLKAEGDLVWKAKKIALDLGVAKPRALIEGGNSGVTAQVKSEPVNFAYKGEVTNATPAKVGGDIDLTVPSVRNLAAWVGNPLPAGNGFGPLSIKGKLAMAGPKMSFNDARIGFDAINATGGVSVDTGGQRPRIDGKLDVDKLDLNPYLPPEGAKPAASGGAQPAAKSAPSQGWSDDPIDLASLKAADANFDLSVGGIQMRKIQIGKGVVAAKLNNGRLNVDLTQLALYQGNGQGKVMLDGSQAVPALDLTFNLAKIQAEPLLRDAADFDKLSGAGAIDLAVQGKGKSQRELINALNGKGKIDFRDGAIKGINLAAMVRNVTSAFTGGGGSAEKTDFSELGGTFTITNGILKNTDMALKSPLIRVEGAGTVDLPKRTVDYKVTPKVVASLEGQGGKDAAGVMVPVLVRGPWDNLRYEPDLAGLIQQGLQDPSKIIEGAKDLKNLPGQLLKPQQPSSGGTPSTPSVPKPTDALKGLLGR